MKKYRIEPRWLDAKIIEINVLKETSHSVFFGNSRQAKKSEYTEYHDTWEEAHSALMQYAKQRVEHARRALELANSKFGNIKGMKKPVEE